jgi:hypothetical protein
VGKEYWDFVRCLFFLSVFFIWFFYTDFKLQVDELTS